MLIEAFLNLWLFKMTISSDSHRTNKKYRKRFLVAFHRWDVIFHCIQSRFSLVFSGRNFVNMKYFEISSSKRRKFCLFSQPQIVQSFRCVYVCSRARAGLCMHSKTQRIINYLICLMSNIWRHLFVASIQRLAICVCVFDWFFVGHKILSFTKNLEQIVFNFIKMDKPWIERTSRQCILMVISSLFTLNLSKICWRQWTNTQFYDRQIWFDLIRTKFHRSWTNALIKQWIKF